MFAGANIQCVFRNGVLPDVIERLRNENENKTETQMTQSFNQYSENETKIWRQSIPTQFSYVSSSCLRSHFVISPMTPLRSLLEDAHTDGVFPSQNLTTTRVQLRFG